jgi:hypothetical protein
VGKRTLVDQLAVPTVAGGNGSVQRKATTDVGSNAWTHQAAARGVATTSSQLPHIDRIQRLFGRHDDKTRGYHTKNITTWEWPPFVLADRTALLHILGDEARPAIGDNRRNLDMVLRAVIRAAGLRDWNDLF